MRGIKRERGFREEIEGKESAGRSKASN